MLRFCLVQQLWLLRLAVEAMYAAPTAELVKLDAAWVVALVLGAGVVPLLAFCAGEVDDYAVLFLCHGVFLNFEF
jgi:hypothetical protein